MSNEEFENYIALVSRLLQLRGKQRDQISVELRDHLQTRAAELESEGQTKQAALRQAIEEFGDAAAMAKNFQSVQNHKRQRWMMRFSTFAIAGVFLAALFTMSMWPGEARFGAPETSIAKTFDDPAKVVQAPEKKPLVSDSAKRDAATEKALESPMNIEYEEVQFADVMAELEKWSGLNFILDETAIDDSLTKEELVTVRVRGVPLAKALELMLGPFNATYAIEEGVVMIISKDNITDPEHLRLKMFDCKKLVAAFGDSGEGKLLNLVQSMVYPESWKNNGKHGCGEASVEGGILIVNQSEVELRQIGVMLTDLRGKILGETEKPAAVSEKSPKKNRKKMSVKKQAPNPLGDGDPFKDDNPFNDQRK